MPQVPGSNPTRDYNIDCSGLEITCKKQGAGLPMVAYNIKPSDAIVPEIW